MVMVDSHGDVCAVCLKPSCAYPARGTVTRVDSQEEFNKRAAEGGNVIYIPTAATIAKRQGWLTFALWLLAAFSASVFAAVFFAGCAELSAYAASDPDVVQKAETAGELAQCVDTAVVKYKRAEVASTAAAVTTIQPDAGTP